MANSHQSYAIVLPLDTPAPAVRAAGARADQDRLDFTHWLLPTEQPDAAERFLQAFSIVMGPVALLATCAGAIALAI